jgi:3',5'-cyclic AMP phosphodiesterase CpdA
MRKNAFAVLLVVGASLFSCGTKSEPALSDYVTNVKGFYSGYRVLQLTDIHWSVETDIAAQSAYLQALFEATTPDFLVVTGDSGLVATPEIMDKLFGLFERWGIPYAVTWGNHDKQGHYSLGYLDSLAARGPRSCYKAIDDEVMGRSNYVVNLCQGTQTMWKLYALDSNSYGKTNGVTYPYDYIHESQVSWFTAEAESDKKSDDTYYPSLSFFHIPLIESKQSYEEQDDAARVKKHKWSCDESYCVSDTESGFFAAAASHGVKGIFYGHDHSNDYVADYVAPTGETVTLGYGVKSGTELYYHDREDGTKKIGGAVYYLRSDGTFNLHHYYVQPLSEGEYAVAEEIYS